MSTILTSELFRNFMGGFVIGAVALFALQPGEADAARHSTAISVEAAIESPGT
ncbi:hypothetical protein [Blastomonas aquatica]|uniref:Uncharacterized protein n=1 Tax=Blastomonas aquatica TaxID=1510276 RepID=A0ABQ1JCB0_9SPHN|nr:hypothetical protein GCM10010833_20600 [Blastomonas aquatica]